MSQQQPSPEEVYRQYQAASEQLQMIESQLQTLNGVISDLDAGITTINGIKNNDGDSEIIIPLGGMVMLRGKLVGKKEILVSIGSGIVANLSPDKAVEQVNARKSDLAEIRGKLLDDHAKLSEYVRNLQNFLNQIAPKV